MSKKEFLEQLENKLSEALPPAAVREHVAYYMNYINSTCAQGKREEDVIAELGDPNLIARTILETSDAESYVYTEAYDEAADNDPEEEVSGTGYMHHIHSSNGSCLIAFLVCLAVLFILFQLIGAVMRLILPVLLPILIIVFIVQMIRRHR